MADDNQGGFASGFAGALSNDLSQREAMKLQMMMLSKRLELEHNQRMAEIAAQGQQQLANIGAQGGQQRQSMATQSQLNSVSKGTIQSLANAMGVPEFDTSKLPDTLTGATGDTAIKALGEYAARKAEIRAMIAGKQTSIEPHFDSTTGIKNGERQNTIFGQGRVEYDSSANPSIEQAKDIAAQRDGLLILKNILSGQPTGPITGNIAAALARAGVDPSAAQTQAGRQALLTAMPKVLAGFNRFNEPEIARLDSTLPSLTNTPDVNQKIFDTAFATLQSRVNDLGMGQDDITAGRPNRFDMRQYISPEGQQLFYGNQGQQQPQAHQVPVSQANTTSNNPFMSYSFGDLAKTIGDQHANHAKTLLKNAKIQDQANGQ